MKNIKIKPLIYCFLLLPTVFVSKVQGQEGIAGLKNFYYGKLDNGMAYFIKDLKNPQTKTYLNLFVKVGLRQEKSGQLDFSHAIEHLAFKPTENFPKSIKDHGLMHRLGMLSTDKSATTGNRYTRYFFNAPKSNPEAVGIGFQWFRDVIGGLHITKENINQERGSLRQEFIYGNGGKLNYYYAECNLTAKLFPCSLPRNDFFEHNRTFTAREVENFYKDWYRPGLMALVIIGNIDDMEAIQKKIQEVFGDIPAHSRPKEKINCDSLYFTRPPQFAVADFSSQRKEVEYRLYYRQPELAKNIGTPEGYKQYLGAQLFFKGLGERLERSLGSTSIRIGTRDIYKYKGMPLAFMLTITTNNFNGKEVIKRVFHAIRQLMEYGFLPEEWESLKKEFLWNRRQEKDQPEYWYRNLQDYFVCGQALFGSNGEGFDQWVEGLELKKFTPWIKNYIEPLPDDIGIIAPTGNKALDFTQNQLYRWMKKAWQQPVKPYRLPEKLSTLMTKAEVNSLSKAKIIGDRASGAATREIILENGMKVVLKAYKPTEGVLSNRIMLHAFSNKGAACFPKEDYYSALNAPAIIKNSAIAGFSPKQLENFMENTGINAFGPYIDFRESGIQGNCKPESLEAMLQLLYCYVTGVDQNTEAFKAWKTTALKAYKNNSNNFVQQDLFNAIRKFEKDSTHPPTFGYRYLKGKEAFESVAKTQSSRAYAIYQQLFGNPRDFTVIISGDFKTETVLPLVQRYLGSLPNTTESLSCPPSKCLRGLPQGPIRHSILVKDYTMQNVKYVLKYIKPGSNNLSWKKNLGVELLGEMADLMALRLRYKKGFSIYNFGVSGSYNPDQNYYQIRFNISCQPEELKAIQKECLKIVRELKREKINDELFQQAVKIVKKRYNVKRLGLHRNMQEFLYGHYRYGSPWIDLEEYKTYLDSIDVKDIVDLARNFFHDSQQYEYIMNDENL